MYFSSSYLGCIYDDPKKYKKLITRVEKKAAELKKKLKFDAIAFRGTSGAAVAYPLSVKLGVPLICVRKDKNNHSGCSVEGPNDIDIKKYIIVDDFIDLGSTVNAIIKTITKEAKKSLENNPICVGILLYNSDPTMKYFKSEDIPVHRVLRV